MITSVRCEKIATCWGACQSKSLLANKAEPTFKVAMYEIVGTDSTLAAAASYNFEKSFKESTEKQVKVESANNAENANDFDSLLDKLVNMCQQPVSVVAAEARYPFVY